MVSGLATLKRYFVEIDPGHLFELLVLRALTLLVIAVFHFAIDKGLQGSYYNVEKVTHAKCYALVRLYYTN